MYAGWSGRLWPDSIATARVRGFVIGREYELSEGQDAAIFGWLRWDGPRIPVSGSDPLQQPYRIPARAPALFQGDW
jgi:hypothetical protein